MAAPFQYNPASPMDSVMNMAGGLSKIFTDRANRQEIARRTQAMYGGMGQAPNTFTFQDMGQAPALQAGGVTAPALGGEAPAAMQGVETPPPTPVMDPEQMNQFRAAVQANASLYPATTEAWLRQQGLTRQEVVDGFGPFSPEVQQKLLQMGKVAVPRYAAGTATPDYARETQTVENVAKYGQGIAQPGMPTTSPMPNEVNELTFSSAAQNAGVPAATEMYKTRNKFDLEAMKQRTRAAVDAKKVTALFQQHMKQNSDANAKAAALSTSLAGQVLNEENVAQINAFQNEAERSAAWMNLWGVANTQGEEAAKQAYSETAIGKLLTPEEAQTAVVDGLRSGVIGDRTRMTPWFSVDGSEQVEPETPDKPDKPAKPTKPTKPTKPGNQAPKNTIDPLMADAPGEVSRFTGKDKAMILDARKKGASWQQIQGTKRYQQILAATKARGNAGAKK